MRKKNTQNIREILNEVIRENHLDAGLTEARIIKLWSQLLGPHVAHATRSIYIKNGVLQVQLTSSIIRNEMGMIKDKIIDGLNREIGRSVIKNINFY